jgi:hypothetical protein
MLVTGMGIIPLKNFAGRIPFAYYPRGMPERRLSVFLAPETKIPIQH